MNQGLLELTTGVAVTALDPPLGFTVRAIVAA